MSPTAPVAAMVSWSALPSCRSRSASFRVCELPVRANRPWTGPRSGTSRCSQSDRTAVEVASWTLQSIPSRGTASSGLMVSIRPVTSRLRLASLFWLSLTARCRSESRSAARVAAQPRGAVQMSRERQIAAEKFQELFDADGLTRHVDIEPPAGERIGHGPVQGQLECGQRNREIERKGSGRIERLGERAELALGADLSPVPRPLAVEAGDVADVVDGELRQSDRSRAAGRLVAIVPVDVAQRDRADHGNEMPSGERQQPVGCAIGVSFQLEVHVFDSQVRDQTVCPRAMASARAAPRDGRCGRDPAEMPRPCWRRARPTLRASAPGKAGTRTARRWPPCARSPARPDRWLSGGSPHRSERREALRPIPPGAGPPPRGSRERLLKTRITPRNPALFGKRHQALSRQAGKALPPRPQSRRRLLSRRELTARKLWSRPGRPPAADFGRGVNPGRIDQLPAALAGIQP